MIPTRTPSARRPASMPALAVAVVIACCAGPATADLVRPWTPASADSIVQFAAQARARFQTNAGDSVGGTNFEAYNLVSKAARRLFAQLGRTHMLQATQVEATLDSLGLDTDVVNDPSLPSITLLMVRNPYRLSADAIGFLFWFRGTDLRLQGAMFPPNRTPRLRPWWTGHPEGPYEAAVLYESKGASPRFGFKLFRLSPDGYYWNQVQYEGQGPDLGEPGDVQFADLNHDGQPEIVSWVKGKPDSIFTFCSECPALIQEFTWTERPEGFVLYDARLVPSPAATFTQFVRLLGERNRAAAARLLATPARVDSAIASGWGTSHGKATWTIEYAEPSQPWPEWFAARYRDAKGDRRYIFHFTLRDGHWVIRDWIPVVGRVPLKGGVSLPDSSAARTKKP